MLHVSFEPLANVAWRITPCMHRDFFHAGMEQKPFPNHPLNHLLLLEDFSVDGERLRCNIMASLQVGEGLL